MDPYKCSSLATLTIPRWNPGFSARAAPRTSHLTRSRFSRPHAIRRGPEIESGDPWNARQVVTEHPNPATEDALANYLEMKKRHQVIALLALGRSFRRIERETGVRRETVSRYSGQPIENRPKCFPTPPNCSPA